ncbi:hypothetical protein [Actinoplanes sp. GCM10030250]|uniref:hypothetical protein n=1 Tax=Actinoplanes sp. GCM10030250 TaxID=3273376 RepID=UPI003621FBD8
MSLLRRMRGEVAGAWRSVNYDLGRRPDEPVDGPDVTSTGMGTFPGSLVDLPVSPPETDARPPRRFVAVTAFCMLAVLGAGGSYFAATSVFAEEPAGVPENRPAAAPAPVEINGQDEGTGAEGMGSGPGKIVRPGTVPPVDPVTGRVTDAPAAQPAGTPGKAPRVAGVTRPGRPATRPADPECHCATPPVPTPTVPSATATTGTPGTGSPSPSETSGSPSTDPSNSGNPGPSVDPSGSAPVATDGTGRWRDGDRRRRYRHHHQP